MAKQIVEHEKTITYADSSIVITGGSCGFIHCLVGGLGGIGFALAIVGLLFKGGASFFDNNSKQ